MMGVVTAKFLFKHIRGAIFGIFVIAAVLTPTTDPLNMTIFAAPMVLLYLVSVALAWFLHPTQRRKRREKREKSSS
jgi:sec-independent protein translocase protein TatC